MSLKVTIQESRFKGSPGPYFIHSHAQSVVSEAAFLDILAEARTTYSKPDIAGVLVLIKEELLRLLAEGLYVKTCLGSFYLCASGSLAAADETFAPHAKGRGHALHLHFRPDKSFEQAVIGQASYERDSDWARRLPYPIKAQSIKGKREFAGKPGDYVKVKGARLSFDENDPESGLFFCNERAYRSEAYTQISSTVVSAEIPPELEPGDYYIALRTRPGGKQLREGKMCTAFKVEAAG